MTHSYAKPEGREPEGHSNDARRDSQSDVEMRESGIAPARGRRFRENTLAGEADDLVQLALAEGTRTEANLNLLMRGLKHLMAGAGSALEANAALVRELDELRELLGRSREQEMALRQRVRMLELGLEYTKREAARERAAFLEQEDAFLEELLSDHEREVIDLRQRLRAASERPAPLTEVRPTIVPPAEPRAVDSSRSIGAMKLRSVRLPRPASMDPITPIDLLPTPMPPRPGQTHPQKQKPGPTVRPSGGYALGRNEVVEEKVQLDRITTRPPSGK